MTLTNDRLASLDEKPPLSRMSGRRTCPQIVGESAHYPILYLMTGGDSREPAILLMTDDSVVAVRYAACRSPALFDMSWGGQALEVVTVGARLEDIAPGPLMEWHGGPFRHAYKALEKRTRGSYVDAQVLVLSVEEATLMPSTRTIKLREWREIKYDKRGRDHDGITLARP